MIIQKPDFCIDADNVYRTEYYIVKQRVILRNKDACGNFLISIDTYYARDDERDYVYETLFADRKNIDGKRIKTAMFTRTYVD